jgi:hypothetical protein
MTQVWVALITYLILAFLRFKAGLGISFQQMVRLLQINLFERRNLIELCSPPPPHVGGTQLLWAHSIGFSGNVLSLSRWS